VRSKPEPALSHDDPSSLAPPEVIGPYRVLHQIGSGVLGPVFRALHSDSQQIVAVKLFRLDWPPERARALAGGLGTLIETLPAHPSLVMPLAAGLDGSTAWLAQDLVAADGLEARMRRRTPVSADVLLGVLRQVASALDASNAAGWRHGALHPRDILVDTGGGARLTGIGVAQVIERYGAQAPRRRPYCAPERSLGHPWDTRADVYALAAIAVEWAGPRRGRGTSEDDLEALLGRAGFDGRAAAAVLARGSAASSNQRPASATALIDALAETVSAAPDADARRRRRAPVAPLLDAVAAPAAPDEPSADADAPTLVAEPPAASRPEVEPDSSPPAVEDGGVASGPEPALAIAEPAPVPGPALEAAAEGTVGGGHTPPQAEGSPPATPAAAEPEPGTPPTAAPRVERPHSMWGAYAPRSPVSVEPPRAAEPDLEIRGRSASVDPIRDAQRDDQQADELWDRRLDADADRERAAVVAPPPARRGGLADWWPWAAVLLFGVAIGFMLGRWSAGPLPGAPKTPEQTAQAQSQPPGEQRVQLADEQARAEPAVGSPAPPAPGTTVDRSPPGAPAPAPVATPQGRRDTSGTRSRQTPAATPLPPDGVLVVRSTPSAAQVRVNGRDRGTTPLTLRGLAPGRYVIETSRAGFTSDSRRVEMTARQPSRTVQVTLKPVPQSPAPAAPRPGAAMASIEFVTRPVGARVFVDGQPIGVTPLRLLEVSPGSKSVRFELAGHRTWTATIAVAAGEARKVAASLEPLP
jgi:serine/threonine protein kinase